MNTKLNETNNNFNEEYQWLKKDEYIKNIYLIKISIEDTSNNEDIEKEIEKVLKKKKKLEL